VGDDANASMSTLFRERSEEFSRRWIRLLRLSLQATGDKAGRFHTSIVAARLWHSRRHCRVEQV